jgi:hypothetical protein
MIGRRQSYIRLHIVQSIEQTPGVSHHLLQRDHHNCQQVHGAVADGSAGEQHAAARVQRQQRCDELAAAVLQPMRLGKISGRLRE